jgi:hypothetical protein
MLSGYWRATGTLSCLGFSRGREDAARVLPGGPARGGGVEKKTIASSCRRGVSFALLTCIISEVAPMSFEVVGRFVD